MLNLVITGRFQRPLPRFLLVPAARQLRRIICVQVHSNLRTKGLELHHMASWRPDALRSWRLSHKGRKISAARDYPWADCDLSSIRLLSRANSAINSSESRPASVAASISVLNRIEVATSALHARQYFSLLPGSSTNSARRPHTLHCAIESCSLPFGPHNIVVPPLARLARTPAHCNASRVGKRP